MNLDQISGLLDMLALEGDAFSASVEAADKATTTSEYLSHTNVAIESGFACVEICGRLREVDPDSVVSSSNVWRDLVRDAIVVAHEVAENRRAELGTLRSEGTVK